MNTVLLIDFGSTYTKVTGVDLDKEIIIGTAKHFTTIDTDINEGLEEAKKILENETGVVQWDKTFACSSAAGGLKMVAVGFVPELTSEAAKRAALSAGAKVIKTYSNKLSNAELEEITSIEPDILLLSGGTDGGNSEVIISNADKLGTLPIDFPVVIAGNKSAADEVKEILDKSGKESIICDNVMPSLNVLEIDSARNAIRDVFLKRIIKAKGLTKAEEIIDGILMPTPKAVLNAAKLLADGYEEEAGIGELMVVDIGGATTDIHSIADGEMLESNVVFKGLAEPRSKRTVEGDLGMRYSAEALVEAVGIRRAIQYTGLSKEEIRECLDLIQEDYDCLPESEIMQKFDKGIASIAVAESFKRHVGLMEIVYTPMGSVYQLTGKDLRDIKVVVGTGGPIVNSKTPLEILENSKYNENDPMVLKPKNTEFLIDKKYIMAAMGVLGENYPEIALRILKKELVKID